MSVANPAFTIPRRSVVNEEAEWVKMFDPPTDSPPTPDLLEPTNPVPAFIAANVPGASNAIPNTVRRRLMHKTPITMWDGRLVDFFTFSDPDIPATAGGTWPAATIRVPRGVIFHGETSASGPPPHTIHWHGIEPTAMNDGVGHCSMELGSYTYQWQPNHIGTYFYHCHRNTMQHFEYGLYGMLLVEPPDAFDNSRGKDPAAYPRRTAANLANFPQFPGFEPKLLETGDPWAMTVPYDVEALWVLDDVDSVWRTEMPGAKDTFPNTVDIIRAIGIPPVPTVFAPGLIPGVNDQFLKGDFHDFNPDYFFCTGVAFPAPVSNTSVPNVVNLDNPVNAFGTPDGTIPAALNSGVAGMQVAVNARINQTTLVRCLNASYVNMKVTFPVDVLIIAFDGRALGVPPFGNYNSPFILPANTPFELSTARRFDALIRSSRPINSFATAEFIHNRNDRKLLTGRIPIVIS